MNPFNTFSDKNIPKGPIAKGNELRHIYAVALEKDRFPKTLKEAMEHHKVLCQEMEDLHA